MNDLRRMLREKADDMRLDSELPTAVRSQARRRRVGNASLVGVIVLGLGVAAFAGARQLVNERPIVPRPAQEPPGGGSAPPPSPADTEVLPEAVAETRDAIQVAANDRDWEALEALIDPNRFEFTFGGERDPIDFWKGLEAEGTPVRDILATLLNYPGTEYEGLFMWPTAAVKEPKDWTEEDLLPLRIIYSEKELEQMREFDSYYGWRVGIEPDGDWIFFVQGD